MENSTPEQLRHVEYTEFSELPELLEHPEHLEHPEPAAFTGSAPEAARRRSAPGGRRRAAPPPAPAPSLEIVRGLREIGDFLHISHKEVLELESGGAPIVRRKNILRAEKRELWDWFRENAARV